MSPGLRLTTRRIATVLYEAGLGRRSFDALQPWESSNDHLGILLFNGPEYLETLMGAHKASVAPFNLNYRYTADEGFRKLFPCPELTGSYLSFDGEHYYLSQWYKGDIHQFDDSGKILRTINVGAEICGHTFARGKLYVLRGKENKDVPGKSEEWRIARLDVHDEKPEPEDLATVPFESRSLTFDGENFWSNHRTANEVVSFSISS